jgi:isopenicillin-N epimerase
MGLPEENSVNWDCGDDRIRALWSLDPDVTFLNHGSYGAVPKKVQTQKEKNSAEIERNPSDFLARRLPALLDNQRQILSQWLNADPDSVALVANATTGVGAVLSSLDWTAGDEIVFHTHGYGWVRQGLANLSRRCGVVVREAAIPWPEVSVGSIVEAFARELSPRTRLLICDHVTSPTALVFPVAKIVALAREASVPVLVDGAHAPGFVPLDLTILDADFYTGNLHKWVCAPRGSAFLSVKPQWRKKIFPQALSYAGGVTNPRRDDSFAGYFSWNGTNDFSSWLSISAALDFNNELGWETLFSKRKKLLFEARDFLKHTLGLSNQTPVSDSLQSAMTTLPWPLRSEVVPDVSLAQALSAELLQSEKIEVPVMCFADRIWFRISVQAYNRMSDYEKLARAVGAHRFSAVRVGVG